MVCHVCTGTFVSVQERFFYERKTKASHIPQASRELRKALRLLPRTRLVERRLSNLDLNDFSHCHPLIQEDKVEKPAE